MPRFVICGDALFLIGEHHALRSAPIKTLSLATSKSGIATDFIKARGIQGRFVDEVREVCAGSRACRAQSR
jgi:hypothetical protein